MAHMPAFRAVAGRLIAMCRVTTCGQPSTPIEKIRTAPRATPHWPSKPRSLPQTDNRVGSNSPSALFAAVSPSSSAKIAIAIHNTPTSMTRLWKKSV